KTMKNFELKNLYVATYVKDYVYKHDIYFLNSNNEFVNFNTNKKLMLDGKPLTYKDFYKNRVYEEDMDIKDCKEEKQTGGEIDETTISNFYSYEINKNDVVLTKNNSKDNGLSDFCISPLFTLDKFNLARFGLSVYVNEYFVDGKTERKILNAIEKNVKQNKLTLSFDEVLGLSKFLDNASKIILGDTLDIENENF
ncbi:MAG: hypothetical protein KBT30_02355, partial [Clostridiales bacterium]|nr:hypothetical protein [Candidatus Apopatousia equi]